MHYWNQYIVVTLSLSRIEVMVNLLLLSFELIEYVLYKAFSHKVYVETFIHDKNVDAKSEVQSFFRFKRTSVCSGLNQRKREVMEIV